MYFKITVSNYFFTHHKTALNTPIFISLKRIYLLFEILKRNKFWNRINPRFSVPQHNLENSSKTPPFWFDDRVWGEWVQRLLWRLPSKIEYLPSSHFLQDGAIHIRKVRKNAFQGCYRLLQQYPRFNERCTVQSYGDDRSMVQQKT